jgi:hypothetical protein
VVDDGAVHNGRDLVKRGFRLGELRSRHDHAGGRMVAPFGAIRYRVRLKRHALILTLVHICSPMVVLELLSLLGRSAHYCVATSELCATGQNLRTHF